MAPRQAGKSAPVTVQRPTKSEDEEVQESSQDQPEMDMLRKARGMMASSKKRREAKRKAIEIEHEKRIKDVRARVDVLFETRKNRVHKAQKVQFKRLDALYRKRQGIESHILSSMRSIELHHLNISSEITAMIDGRLEEIAEAQVSSEIVESH